MYRFEAVDKEAGAPIFIEFNDHIIEPCKAAHFHFRYSNTSFDDIEDPENRWPTFYPAEYDADEMLDAFVGHDHSEEGKEEHEHEHEEIETEDIMDRDLSDFDGEWKSLYPMLMAGELDAYLEHEAEEENTTKEEVLEEVAAKWACDAVSVKIDGDTIAFTDAEGNTVNAVYTYAGFTPITAEDGDITGVRYQYETDNAGAPKYVQFNDHGHKPAAAEHFHLYFGNDGFEALMALKTNSFFAPADMSTASVLSMLMSHNHEHDHEHEHEEETDEHVWLSLRNAQKLVKALASALEKADPANVGSYAAGSGPSANADAYSEKLAALDAEYAAVRKAADFDTVLFGDRFPFRYLVDDYDLNYYAAFSGCSAESEASFETIVFLAGKVDELGLSTVLTIEGDNHRIAETIVGNTRAKDAKVLAMDSMQATTINDAKNGITYLGVMEANLEALKRALTK